MDIPSLQFLATVTLYLVIIGVSGSLFVWHLRAWWHECHHDPADTDFVDIPPEWGFDAGVWCVCRHCGARTVITRARLRQLDLE